MSRVIEVVERYIVPDIPEIDLPGEDGIPLETNWHRIQINLLVDSTRQHWHGRTDFFAGGNMFIYYSLRQARSKDYKGPDFFVVKDVDGTRDRPAWITWEEDGRLPDVIVELLSPSTAAEDLGTKKDLYERTFKTPEYFCYNPDTRELLGWQLEKQRYVPLQPSARGHLWSEQFQVWLGLWEGDYEGIQATWLRFHDAAGRLLPTGEEAERRRAEAEHQRAEAERQRADAAEAELVRLRAELERRSRDG
ncbi:MAG TPA: Uma2 family endonuclease [Anaerolineae bacterium]|nr:Uma2 family endonuclease [Anaerolineae bacterium]